MADQQAPAARRLWLFVAQAGAGLALGLVGLLVGGWAGRLAGAGSANGWGDLVGAVFGGFGGCALGTALGVVGMARLLQRRGSAWGALAGSALGALAALFAATRLGLQGGQAVFLTVYAFASLAGALAGFSWRRAARR